ncbi:NAD-dependent epimerase/dehydratase family protein [Nocardia bhagyanarayanae]|uniref:Nucleoside-diphosphate-sugar epimerase n=1 Tax=Nocardia bhagyanarayanae TaxID=1215925 RepID=A0A543FBC6_9NOCA|nr:NAD-dependent epimerase/dehydratase family protein [Nocardia bhagyanarayanae]TQM31103.1 nucleoside-diphosphate-sugar epimerase [Nocardia bhagyanarayanae]
MSLRIVLGAGPVGSAVALLLAERGDRVRLVTRSGSGPDHPLIERITTDATDVPALEKQTAGATALYQCAQPPYSRWSTQFPPLVRSAIEVAERTGALLASVGNLYGYGEFDGPVRETHPQRPNSTKGRLRAQLWTEASTAHEAGRIRAVEVRGSDYLGAGANSVAIAMVLNPVRNGKLALVPGDPDAPHSWTVTGDVAKTLVAAADDETAWGAVWHVPSAPPLSLRALADLTAAVAAAPSARVRRMPYPLLWAAGLLDSDARELCELRYQFERPFVLDSSAATVKFGITPTLTEVAVRATLAALPTR